ncbi:P-loop NTPase fold protein [Burkholderia sp. L27(2015)]|uniref:P-loop NTPase fold protein n=1 Tax=Burkholderia sp. L27(2015) TaxID=1641858 RepID=UPI00131DA472|nr:P-loop NTPase fold protein [Burkholderia sp. L27(2015)]
MAATELSSFEQHRVFLLYNEREDGIDKIADLLHSFEISTYFFRRDGKPGDEFEKIEDTELRQSSTVVIILGERGWGPTQRKLAERAVILQKQIIPVLIGNPPEEALDDIDGLFRRRLRVDLTGGSGSFDQLLNAIRSPTPKLSSTPPSQQREVKSRFDEILWVIVNGTDVDRSVLLDRVIRGDIANREELAIRIRTALSDEYSVSRARQFVGSPRDQARGASIRGWLLSILIGLEADSDASYALILRHIDAKHEPDRTVRFWTLAGVIGRNPSYRQQAQDKALGDNAPEVALLASVSVNPNDESLLLQLRTSLQSDDIDVAWPVLRLLRAFPVPELASVVVDQLARNADWRRLRYDALFALSSPKMAHAARASVLEIIGLEPFSALVLDEARSAEHLSQRAFGRLLSVFDFNDVRDALRASSGEADRTLVYQLLSDMSDVQQKESPSGPVIAGYASDTIDISKDDIGISRDVETLASVMLAREVVPPLAIGLFGEWGAGKSFFMRSIDSTVKRIAQKAEAQNNGPFCSDVVQIHFNAWHYVDTNLLASLVSHILGELSSHLTPAVDGSETYSKLTRELESVRAEVKATEAERKLAAEQLNKASQALQESIFQRERRELRLRDLRYSDLVNLLAEDKDLKKEVEEALYQVGAPAALDSFKELSRVVEQSYSIGGRAASLIASIFNGRSVPWAVGGIILLFVAPPVVGWVIAKLIDPNAAAMSALAAQVTVVVGSISTVISKALGHAKNALKALSEAKRKVDAGLAAKRSEPTADETRLESELAQAKAEEQTAAEQVAVVSARAKELEDRVTAMQQGRSLSYFVAERAKSEDYRQHLGLISVIRRDFDGLVQRLRTGQDGLRRVDRIVLYIDDVDRCPPNVVVEILQAVHLLLAYELFVVVVSVDPRWLLRSLETKFSHLKREGPVAGSVATAQDYLDKIFQIPFSVRPMNDLAFSRMMQRLLAPTSPQSATVDDMRNEDGPAGLGSIPAHTATEDPMDATPVTEYPTSEGEAAAKVATPRDLTELAQALSINKAEAAFAGRLHGLLPTPRSAKRFANVYRLLKASVPPRKLVEFEGTLDVPGTFQVPMLLLAALIGDPTLASSTFPIYLTQATEGDTRWWVKKAKVEESEDAARALQAFESVVAGELFPHNPKLICEWLPLVARYSFLTARMFLETR